MCHVIPYFGTPRRILSDRGREFISSIWTKLLRCLGVQQVLISPYHPEGNAINERSHRTLNNMLRACLLEGPSTKAWVEKVPGIMLTLSAMPHEPHGFSAPSSMVSRAGRIRFCRETPALEVTNPRRWTKPPTSRPATSRRHHPAGTTAGG